MYERLRSRVDSPRSLQLLLLLLSSLSLSLSIPEHEGLSLPLILANQSKTRDIAATNNFMIYRENAAFTLSELQTAAARSQQIAVCIRIKERVRSLEIYGS